MVRLQKPKPYKLFIVCPQKRYAAPAPGCYCWWGTKSVNLAHGESAIPRIWGQVGPPAAELQTFTMEALRMDGWRGQDLSLGNFTAVLDRDKDHEDMIVCHYTLKLAFAKVFLPTVDLAVSW